MIALLILTSSSYAIGSLILRRLGLRSDRQGETLLFAIGLGLGLWCLLLFLLGHCNLLHPRLLIGIAIAAALPSPFLLHKQFHRSAEEKPDKSPLSLLYTLSLVGISCILLLTFLSSFAPVTGGICNDEICTHLSVPREWLRHHGIVMLPFSVSYMAGNAHLLFLLASCFDPESGPRLVSWLCFVLCLAAVYSLARRFLDRNGAIIAVLATAMNPLIFRGSCIAFVDLESALFALLPLMALVSYHRDNRQVWLVLCGFFMGIGCGIKPTNIIYSAATILIAGPSCFFGPGNILQAVRSVFLLCIVTALFASPWPIRNLVLTGSPTFPPPLALYHSGGLKPLSGSKAPYSYDEIKDFYRYCLSRYGDYRRNPVSFARFPWDLTMHPERFQIGDSIGTLFLSFLPLTFLFFPLPRLAWLLIGFAATSGFFLYFAVLPESRYYMAGFMALGPVIAYAMGNLNKNRLARPAVFAVIAINILFSLGVAVRISIRPIRAAFSPEYRQYYCRSSTPYCEAFEYLRAHRVDTVLVNAPSQIFYYLQGDYKVDTALGRAGPSYAGRIALAIDYSQVLGRDSTLRPGAYGAAHPLPDNTRLLFEGPDARVYTFAAPIHGKEH